MRRTALPVVVVVLSLVAVLLGCSDNDANDVEPDIEQQEIDRCNTAHAEDSGGTFLSDPDNEDRRDSVREYCLDDAGQPEPVCDTGSIITRETAICVAQSQGLEEGVEKWVVNLAYNSLFDRMTWNLRNTLEANADEGTASGETLYIDALLGRRLGGDARYQWHRTP